MTFAAMDSIFNRTKEALMEFMGIITPIIENAKDDHERLYWHHIYEEEEHRSDRLDILLPKISVLLKNEVDISSNQLEFVHLLQDISLEKFGLHNFLEHLDLSLFQFKGTEFEGKIQTLRDFTYEDYQQMKVILEKLNQEFKGGIQFKTSIPTDEKEGISSNLKIETYSHNHSHNDSHGPSHPIQKPRKTLTVGSLKQQ
ncbi:IMEF encapsulin system ferritin-like cargo protein [Peribacillus frigoritolerans]|uniref:IMEF encapsulin system ferritin-like cargo protein n=1 Tax=Peribacillus TaxID=2675229 RepID=UPI001F4F4EE8|nr:IMEF encapsulin system ferritin-like cargo protein [Peribacillus simplex]